MLPALTSARGLRAAACAIGATLMFPALAGATSQTFSIPNSVGPQGIALDSSGNIYTANRGSNDVARITPGGVVTDPFASSGGTQPWAIVTDSSGNIFVSNALSNTVRKITPGGTTTPFAATGAYPQGLVIDAADFLYTANGSANTVTKITPAGTPTTPFATTGNTPYSIALAPSGNIYTGDYYGDAITKITPGGTSTTPFAAATDPAAIAVGPEETVYTAGDDGSGTVTKVTSDGTATRPFATVGSYLSGIAVDSCGNVYATARSADTVAKILPNGSATTLGATGDGPGGIVIDGSGNLYVTNYSSRSVTKFTGGGGTPAICPAPPAAPRVAPSATVISSSSATVTVTPNATDAKYGTPGSYVVEAVGDQAKSCTVTPPANSCQVTGLAADTAYTFTARAFLNEARSAASAPSNTVTTPGDPVTRLLTAEKSGDGSGTITSTPSGIDCGSACSASFDLSAEVTLTATPASGSTFGGWGGACSGSATTCTVTMLGDRSVTVAFTSDNLAITSTRASGNSAVTRVRVPGAGRITQRGTYRTSGAAATKTACTDSKSASKAGVYTLTCRLNSAARQQRRKGKLRVVIRTTYTPTGGTARSTVRTVVFSSQKPRYTG